MKNKTNSSQENYSKILKLVQDGLNISDAIKFCGVNRSNFYRNITNEQKQEIYYAKKLHTKYGVGKYSDYTKKI